MFGNTLSDSGTDTAPLNNEFDAQNVSQRIFSIVTKRIESADTFGKVVLKNQICLVVGDDSVIINNIFDIRMSLAKKIKPWLDDYLPKFKNMMPKCPVENLKKINKEISLLTINGTVDDEIKKMQKKVLLWSVNNGVIIPVNLDKQDCRLIGAEEFAELIQQKQ